MTVVPLTHLTQKDAPWNFSTDCRHSFNLLKEAFTSTPILTHYQPNAPIIVETDASDYAIAGILSNICPDSEIHPVAFLLVVATVTTRNSRRPKMHTKPTQRHTSGRERVQRPSTEPQRASEQREHARYLSLFFVKSIFALYLLYLDSSLSLRHIGIHMYPSALRPSHFTFYD